MLYKTWHKGLLLTSLTTLISACGGELNIGPLEDPHCRAPEGHTLTTIESVVDWINAMPKPLSLPCFTRSLPRPLKVYISEGRQSAQPALSAQSPRYFIFINGLTLSVVPDSEFPTQPDGSPKDPNSTKFNQLELSQPTKGYSSIKGELRFPVKETLPRNAAYANLEYSTGYSICGICHRYEDKVGSLDGVSIFQSDQKMPAQPQAISVAFNEYKTCNASLTPYHCNMMNALFEPGPVVWQDFPDYLQGHF